MALTSSAPLTVSLIQLLNTCPFGSSWSLTRWNWVNPLHWPCFEIILYLEVCKGFCLQYIISNFDIRSECTSSLSSHRLVGNIVCGTRHESNQLSWSWSQKCLQKTFFSSNRSLRETKEVLIKESLQKKRRREEPEWWGVNARKLVI